MGKDRAPTPAKKAPQKKAIKSKTPPQKIAKKVAKKSVKKAVKKGSSKVTPKKIVKKAVPKKTAALK